MKNRRDKHYEKLMRMTMAQAGYLSQHIPIALKNPKLDRTLRRLKQHPPKLVKVAALGDDVQEYFSKLKIGQTKRALLEARLKAISFLNYHFDFSTLSDSIISNLQSLLLDQRNEGIAFARRQVQAKKRKN